MIRESIIEEIKSFLEEVSPESKVFIGCDSTRHKNADGDWIATYSTAIVIHVDNAHGCRVFCDTESMRDYDQRKDRPSMRMMNEAYKAVEAYGQLEYELMERDVEVHLDVNGDPRYGSNCAMAQTVGFVKGSTGRDVKIKPFAFAASYAADHRFRGGYAH